MRWGRVVWGLADRMQDAGSCTSKQELRPVLQVVWCGVVWCGVVWCGVVWCGVVWCGVMSCDVQSQQAGIWV